MINWDEFEHIHVIKKLKQILNTWWNIEIIFSDERGHLKGFSDLTKIKNPAVSTFLGKDKARENLSEHVENAIAEIRSKKNNNNDNKTQNLNQINQCTLRSWDLAGYDIGVFSIQVEGEFMGCVIALGFLKDQGSNTSERLNKIREQLGSVGISTDLIEGCISKIKILDGLEFKHFVELVDLVAQEIIVLHLEITSREDQIRELNKELGSRYKYDNMIGKSKPMQSLYSLLDKIKTADSTVLIQGDNGTGKELIAKALHYNSLRKDKSFVVQNCSAFNDNLLESELFGHVKGSFTGAIRDKKGLFELADKGTFFLDEIGDTSTTMQVKLLRVIQEGTFIPVGSIEPRKVDVRIIAATNKHLKEMVDKGTFREDLYYRLNVINIRVPPLRERKEDIPILVDFFLNKSVQEGGVKKVLTKRAFEKLYDYHWPGNVRELQNEIERLIVLSGDENKINAELLSPRMLDAVEKNKIQNVKLSGNLKEALEEVERDLIKDGLRRTGWNKSKLAKELGISRAGLISKVEKYGLDKRKIMAAGKASSS